MRRFLARLLSLLNVGAAERELAREIESHITLIEDDFLRRGYSPADAKLAARRAYGGVEQAKELHREARSFQAVEHFLKDLRYGARNLLRTPGFTGIAIITLALGIGANTAVFTVVNAVLMRPLSYQDPDRLVTLLHNGTGPVAVANYIDWRDQSRSFETMAAAEYWTANLTGGDQPEHVAGLQMTQNLLPMLGVNPLHGRLFIKGEDLKGADHSVILSHRLWQRSFSGDPAILGKPISLNGEPYTVVGIMPPDFRFAPFWATRAEFWVPLAFGDRVLARGGNSLRVFARLKPDVTLQQARAEITSITERLERQYPGTNRRVVVTPLKENVVGKVETPLLVLLCAVGFVLLIACANVAHMLLARTSDRQREIAVRTALGASRARVISQLLTENLLLSAIGGCAGFLLALWGTKALVALSPAKLPRLENIAIDAHAILFLSAITVFTAIVFGLAPAMHAAALNLSGALKEGGRSGTDGARRNRLRGFLVASEFALAFMLLIGAGLMIRSFSALHSVDPGFKSNNLLSMVVSVAGSNEAEPARREVFYRQLVEQVRALPGVQSASGINHLPLAGDLWEWNFVVEGRSKPRPGEFPSAAYRIAMPGYFETMGIPLLRGRTINDSDHASAPGVVVINESAAQEYWPGEDPVGKRITFEANNDQPIWLTVIGIAANAKQYDWRSKIYPEVYLSALQNRGFLTSMRGPYLTLVVRTAGNPADMAPAIRRTVWSFNRNLPVSDVLTMDRVIADATAQPRFEMLLLAVFAGVALILAAVGIYGVVSYSIARRRHEIGIRLSLGASRGNVLQMLLRQGLKQALIGAAAGVLGALLLSRLMTNMLYAVEPTDPLTFIAVALVLAVSAILATWLPARRAVRIEPMLALRNE